MDWEKVWNSRKPDSTNIISFNGYQIKDLDNYHLFIDNITKNVHIEDNSCILDLGCGNGYLIDYVIKLKKVKNCVVYGIDFCKNNIEFAKKNYSQYNFILGDFREKLPYSNFQFDFIISVSSLFYLKNYNELGFLVKEIKRVSKSNSTIFLGNICDFDKKDLALEERKKTHPGLDSEHLYIEKSKISNLFGEYNQKFIDNTSLNISFYPGYKYKYNLILRSRPINIGVDFHDTLSYHPEFFKNIFKCWNGKKVIITGTPLSKKNEIIENLKTIGFNYLIDYDEIECGYEYEKENMDYGHFERMKIHKLNSIRKHDIKVYYDDNPYYVNYLKDKNITVFQVILSNNYIEEFEKKDKYFCCNLQKHQFRYLENLQKKKENIYLPGVFDLCHLGHLKLFRNLRIKQSKNIIIVGVQEDESVEKSKNRRPVMNTNERMNYIENLGLVDKVISYSNMDQSSILQEYEINKFVIGPEFGKTIEHQKTLKYCLDNQIEIIRTERTKNISTTEIINRIKNRA